MTKFKVGDKFIPRKPNHYDIANLKNYWNCTYTVRAINNEWVIARENGLLFHIDWCEKVEECPVDTNKTRRHITEKELKIAANQIGLKLGVLEHLIAKVRKNQLQKTSD